MEGLEHIHQKEHCGSGAISVVHHLEDAGLNSTSGILSCERHQEDGNRPEHENDAHLQRKSSAAGRRAPPCGYQAFQLYVGLAWDRKGGLHFRVILFKVQRPKSSEHPRKHLSQCHGFLFLIEVEGHGTYCDERIQMYKLIAIYSSSTSPNGIVPAAVHFP